MMSSHSHTHQPASVAWCSYCYNNFQRSKDASERLTCPHCQNPSPEWHFQEHSDGEWLPFCFKLQQAIERAYAEGKPLVQADLQQSGTGRVEIDFESMGFTGNGACTTHVRRVEFPGRYYFDVIHGHEREELKKQLLAQDTLSQRDLGTLMNLDRDNVDKWKAQRVERLLDTTQPEPLDNRLIALSYVITDFPFTFLGTTYDERKDLVFRACSMNPSKWGACAAPFTEDLVERQRLENESFVFWGGSRNPFRSLSAMDYAYSDEQRHLLAVAAIRMLLTEATLQDDVSNAMLTLREEKTEKFEWYGVRDILQHTLGMACHFASVSMGNDDYLLVNGQRVTKGQLQQHYSLRSPMAQRVFLVHGKDRQRKAWHYVHVTQPLFKLLRKLETGTIDVANFGEVIKSGWGDEPPEDVKKMIEFQCNAESDDRDPYPDQHDCSICLLALDKIRFTTICGHQFHHRCIVQWLKQDVRCPICRSSLY